MLSWYLHQPESYQLSLKNVGEWVTSRPQVYLGPIRIVKIRRPSTASTASTVKMLCSVLIRFGICTTTKRGSSDPCKFPFYATHCHFFMSATFFSFLSRLSSFSPAGPSAHLFCHLLWRFPLLCPFLILFSLYVTSVSSEQVRFRKENPGNSTPTFPPLHLSACFPRFPLTSFFLRLLAV